MKNLYIYIYEVGKHCSIKLFSISQKMKRSSEIITEIFLLSSSFLLLSEKREFYALEMQVYRKC